MRYLLIFLVVNSFLVFGQENLTVFADPLPNYHKLNLDTLTAQAGSNDVVFFIYGDDGMRGRNENQMTEIAKKFSENKTIGWNTKKVHFYGLSYKDVSTPDQYPTLKNLSLSSISCIVYTKDQKRLQRAADMDPIIKVDGSKTPENYYDIIILDSTICLGYDVISYYDLLIQDFINPQYSPLEKARMSQEQLENAYHQLEKANDSLANKLDQVSIDLANSKLNIDSITNERKHQNRFKNKFLHTVNFGLANHSLIYESIPHPLSEINTIQAKSSLFEEYTVDYFLHSNLYIGSGLMINKFKDRFEYKLSEYYTNTITNIEYFNLKPPVLYSIVDSSRVPISTNYIITSSDSTFIAIKNDTTGINKSNRIRIPLRLGLHQEIGKMLISLGAETGFNYLRQKQHATVQENELIISDKALTFWDLSIRFTLRYPIIEREDNPIYLSFSYIHQPELQITDYSGNLNVRSRYNFIGVGLATCFPTF